MSEMISLSGAAEMTKTLMQSKVANLLQDIKAGKSSALKTYIQAKYMSDTLAMACDQLKEEAFTEASKYPKGDRVLYGVGFEVREGREMLEYEADEEYARIKAQLKAREEILKQATKGKGSTLDPVSGEVIKPVPVKAASSTLAISFQK